jgi:hypothetical protein
MRLLLGLCIVAGAPAFGGPIGHFSLTFDYLQDGEQVLSYYDGGFGGLGSGPGPSLGVSFTDGLAADHIPIAFGPSARLTAPSVTMNLKDPWDDVISFYFVGSGVASFYSGLDATGDLVRSHVLSYPWSFPDFFPGYPFAARPGTFRSVLFASDTGLQLDSISFGLIVIPEPSSLLLVSVGILAVAGLRRRRSQRQR